MAGIKRTAEFYLRAVKGSSDKHGKLQYGLRDVASGFSAKDGYRLDNVANWTPAQKAKVTRYFHELDRLTAQPRYVYKARSKAMLEKVQAVTGHDKGFKFKVAFVPHVPKRDKKGRETKPRVDLAKTGAVRIRERYYTKSIVALDQRRLARDAKAEVKRAIDTVPNAKRFTIQAGTNEMPGLYDRPFISERVIRLMNLYDGRKSLPKGSGNAGDSPKHHKWTLWLNGLVAYEFPKVTQKAVAKAVTDFDAARRELQKRRRAARKRAEYERSKRK